MAGKGNQPAAAGPRGHGKEKSELQRIYDAANAQQFRPAINILPPTEDFTFEPIGTIKNDDMKYNDDMLFLGGNQNVQIWAILKEYDDKAAQVLFMKKEGGVVGYPKNLDKLPVQYPFKALSGVQRSSVSHLKCFIKYMFLEGGKENTKLFGPGEDPFTSLKRGLNIIWKVYSSRGVTTIPNQKRPIEPNSLITKKKDARGTRTTTGEASDNADGDLVNGTIRSMGEMSILPTIHGKRPAIEDLRLAAEKKKKQKLEDEEASVLEEKLARLKERKAARNDQIQKLLDGKSEEDFRSFFLGTQQMSDNEEEDRE
ncbi:hypothetical protein K491DRAFT_713191 [Lophiostoma macrostomum CBS 122681]|uniref:Uncharacterized protein n=1 Tax=Lophiostoma macrostomum CBS 122681 TaxID=1314788 RepID=A0A6A6THL7_9PLEO|nr:hypothetical protein K491DRAFT_713191 [Lophiostoma macrostomum CBS 122681]